MVSFLADRLATVVIQALNRSIADDTLDALVTQGDRQVLEVAHRVHVMVVLFDCFFNLVFDKCVEILDLFACQAAPFGPPFGVLSKPDLPEPLLFRNTMCGLIMLPAALHKVALVCAMVTKTMILAILFFACLDDIFPNRDVSCDTTWACLDVSSFRPCHTLFLHKLPFS
eukprot:15366135-Ditylum_brightwellii.AAC.2